MNCSSLPRNLDQMSLGLSQRNLSCNAQKIECRLATYTEKQLMNEMEAFKPLLSFFGRWGEISPELTTANPPLFC